MSLCTVGGYIDNLTNEQIDILLDNIQNVIDDLRGDENDTVERCGTDTE